MEICLSKIFFKGNFYKFLPHLLTSEVLVLVRKELTVMNVKGSKDLKVGRVGRQEQELFFFILLANVFKTQRSEL